MLNHNETSGNWSGETVTPPAPSFGSVPGMTVPGFLPPGGGGWIKIYRKITENSFWLCEPFTRGQAWVDILLLANYENSFFYVRGVKVNVDRGQLAWSEPKLAARWRWSRTKVRKFLNDLEKEQQIIIHKNNITQLVTVCNYENYQQKEQQTIQQKDSRKTAEVRIKESKEGKEDYIYTAKLFYEKELGLSMSDKNYQRFIDFLFGKNDLSEPLITILKIKDQISFDQFKKLKNKYDSAPDGKKLSDMIYSMHNDDKYTKGKKSLYLTLNNWVTQRFTK